MTGAGPCAAKGGFPYPGRTCAEWKPQGGRIRPVPDDFATVAPTFTVAEGARHWRACERVVARWYRQTGIKPAPYDHSARLRSMAPPPPADFAAVAPTMGLKDLLKRYRVGARSIHRWCQAVGVVPKPRDYRRAARKRWEGVPKAERKAPPRRARLNRQLYAGPSSTLAGRAPRDTSLHGEAADYLRRDTFVFRCGEKGRADQKGAFWRVGNVVLTPAELIERAERKGFNPRAWADLGSQIAACEADRARAGR